MIYIGIMEAGSATLDQIQQGLENLRQHREREDGMFSNINPFPETLEPFRLDINTKYLPLMIVVIKGSVKYRDVHFINREVLNKAHELDCKLKIVFDLKKTNFLSLAGVNETFRILTDNNRGEIPLLRYIDRVCFLFPSVIKPGSKYELAQEHSEHREVRSAVQLGCIHFLTLRKLDTRFRKIRVRFLYHNRDVDRFMDGN